MILTHLVMFSFFAGATASNVPVPLSDAPAGSQFADSKSKGKKRKPIRWSDFSSQEDRAQALAQAIAEAGIKIAPQENFDEIEADDEALMAALLISKVIH